MAKDRTDDQRVKTFLNEVNAFTFFTKGSRNFNHVNYYITKNGESKQLFLINLKIIK